MGTLLQDARVKQLDRTATWKLWNWVYECKSKAINETSDADIKHFGIISSGDAKVDDQLMQNWNDVMLTPVAMAYRISQGMNIIISNPEASVVIYEHITDYLNGWVKFVEARPRDKIPYDTIMAFDRLATLCWRVGRNYITEQIGTGHLIARLNAMMLNGMNKGAVHRTVSIEPEHESTAAAINKALLKHKQPWRS